MTVGPEQCRACLSPTLHFADGQVLGDTAVAYHRCSSCGLVMAVDPHWLDRAYSQAIAALDIGLLDRCQILAAVTSMVLKAQRLRGGRFLDWAGGYGTLTRLMRDRGYDFTHMDPMAGNVFAAGHATDGIADGRFDLVTAFEVLEHLVDPAADLAEVAASTDLLLTTTHLFPQDSPRPGEWWYYAPESGQHITFYTRASLEELARRLGFDGVVVGSFVHLFHRGRVSAATRRLVRSPGAAYGLGLAAGLLDRRHSLLDADLRQVEERLQRPTGPDDLA